MLKIYDVKSMFRLNNQEEWQVCGHQGYTCKDEDEIEDEKIIFENLTWVQFRDYLKINHIDGMQNRETYFKKHPYVLIYTPYNNYPIQLFEKHADSISYKHIYIERKDVTLDWIIKHCTADETITYLKQRGIQTCPILK